MSNAQLLEEYVMAMAFCDLPDVERMRFREVIDQAGGTWRIER